MSYMETFFTTPHETTGKKLTGKIKFRKSFLNYVILQIEEENLCGNRSFKSWRDANISDLQYLRFHTNDTGKIKFRHGFLNKAILQVEKKYIYTDSLPCLLFLDADITDLQYLDISCNLAKTYINEWRNKWFSIY